MDLKSFVDLKQKELTSLFKKWSKEAAWNKGQYLSIQGTLSSSKWDVEIEIIERKGEWEVIDRLLTVKELNSIASIDCFDSKQSALVNFFFRHGNRPVAKRELRGYLSQIEQVNSILKEKEIFFSLCSLNKIHKFEDPWDQKICFRPISRT